jgi:hypothetical protein
MITRARPAAQRILLTVSKAWWGAVLRLASVLAGIGLTTSRLGLIVHELGGHGATAVAFGGEITDFRLFWFAGGWIRYDFTDPTREALVTISLGGIAIEAVIGSVLWLAIRKDGLAQRLIRGVGAALVIHAAWYFATGTWHGYGDGLPAYKALGDCRYPAAIAGGLIACGAAFVAARLVLGALAALVPGRRRAQLVGVVVAVGLATGAQAGLAIGEIMVRGDNTYGAIMRPERERLIAREYAAWQRDQKAHDIVISDADREAELRKLAAKHREPPFMPILLGLLGVSVSLGAWRARPAPDGTLTRRLQLRIAMLALGSVATVIAIDFVFH